MVARTLAGRLYAQGVTEFGHLQEWITVVLAQGVSQVRDAGRGGDCQARPSMDFVVKDMAILVILHYFHLLWACSGGVNAAQST
jgi:hypothetical protein